MVSSETTLALSLADEAGPRAKRSSTAAEPEAAKVEIDLIAEFEQLDEQLRYARCLYDQADLRLAALEHRRPSLLLSACLSLAPYRMR
jgi:hypothetical protein